MTPDDRAKLRRLIGSPSDLSESDVQWIRERLLVGGHPEAKCESCSVIVTTRIPDGTDKRPSCFACEVGRQRSIAVLLAAAEDEPSAGTQLDLLAAHGMPEHRDR